MHKVIAQLSQDIFALVASEWKQLSNIHGKTSPDDIVSSLDLAVDQLITDRLHQAFPQDVIVTEESSADQFPNLVAGQAGWVVDPICGSMNAVRGIKLFTTNIVRVEQGKVTAAWVLDHSLNQVIWSEGQPLPHPDTHHPTKLIDLCPNQYLFQQFPEISEHYLDLVRALYTLPNVNLRDLQSSLVSAYVATGQMDGSIIPVVKPWDILAACFLVEKAGGIATYFNGQPWDIHITSAILANTQAVHSLLLDHIRAVQLDTLR
ncbi:MAG: inositol monophosphatase [Candidatus Kerfeldbacteria bacterium]|nr:inositol monophosphatase [Candidatus Kerfeldbacteria bacterium]